jgi:ketosteroid isomerase-like protein
MKNRNPKEVQMSKVFILLVALGVMLTMCCPQKANVEAEKAQVKAVLDNYVTSIENEDMDLYAKTMAHLPDMVNFGTSEAPIVGWDALKKIIDAQNAALSETKITVTDLNIHVPNTGKLAWATCLWNFKCKIGEKPIELPVRCTWILEKQDQGWVVVHFHKSVASAE